MKHLITKTPPSYDDHPLAKRARITGRVKKRPTKPVQLRIELPNHVMHDFNDSLRYRVYHYTTSPGCFAVTTTVPIDQHEVFRFEGVIYKVARVEELDKGVVEIKGVVFQRLQG